MIPDNSSENAEFSQATEHVDTPAVSGSDEYAVVPVTDAAELAPSSAVPSLSVAPTQAYRLPPIIPLVIILEFMLIIGVAFSVTAQFRRTDQPLRIAGSELEWLTNSVTHAVDHIHEAGRLAYWNPYMEIGEPTIDNPFSLNLNPFTMIPALMYGVTDGLRLSLFIYALLAGLGGWTLGRVLGLGAVGRVLLALLLIGKGNMTAMISTGYYQLGVSQAYLPWIIAAAIGIFRMTHRRWPVVLLPIMFTLMFWSGNIWYTLPALMLVGLMFFFHVIKHRPEASANAPVFQRFKIDWLIVRRTAFAAIFTLMLAAVTFLPIYANQDRIAGHPNEKEAGAVVDLGKAAYQYVNGDMTTYFNPQTVIGQPQFYYSFVMPIWFGLVFFVLLPPIGFLYKAWMPQSWRIWLPVTLLLIFTTIWGAGGNPVMILLYRYVPLIGQWRFVGRALAMGSFCLAILMAMRVDGLLRAIMTEPTIFEHLGRLRQSIPDRAIWVTQRIALVAITIACLAAGADVNRNWYLLTSQIPIDTIDNACVNWLRTQFPERPLAVYRRDYVTITTYIQHKVRLYVIASDFHMIPNPSTMLQGRYLHRTMPEFGIAWDNDSRAFLESNGYVNLENSPNPVDQFHCLWQKADAMPYAFTRSKGTIEDLPATPTVADVNAITTLVRGADYVSVVATGLANDQNVLSVQEVAYPGWSVTVDGVPAPLESVGGQIGVVLPVGVAAHQVLFVFDPPLLKVGGIVSLFGAALCVLYLLHADWLLPESLLRGTGAALVRLIRLLLQPR